jgi:predicted NUDIX family NTP pyrophosphohydrolase
MPGHHHTRHHSPSYRSRNHSPKRSIFIPPQGPQYVYPSHPIMIPVPIPPPFLPNYMPFFTPRNVIDPIDNLKSKLNLTNRSRFGEIKYIGIIFVTPKGILFTKNELGEPTIPYGEKYSYETNNDAVLRIFREKTGFHIDASKTRVTDSYDRLRRTGVMAKFFIIYTNQYIDSDRVIYIKYDKDFPSYSYPDFVRSLFRDLIDKNDLRFTFPDISDDDIKIITAISLIYNISNVSEIKKLLNEFKSTKTISMAIPSDIIPRKTETEIKKALDILKLTIL